MIFILLAFAVGTAEMEGSVAEYIMAFDAGTSSVRSILFDKAGNIRSMAQREIRQIFPKPGWVEHDPAELWSSQVATAAEAIAKIGARDIAAIGIANQRETAIVWDRRTGKPIHNAIVWQCRRTAEYCDELRSRGLADSIREKTGLVPDAYFSATKIRWLLDNIEGARELAGRGELLFGTVDTWLAWNLTRGRAHVTDCSNASRTMLYNIREMDWDDGLLAEFGIPRAMLPKVLPSSHVYGAADAGVLGREIKIAGIAGDQQAALFGQCCFEKGMVKNTYGTGCFILMNTGDLPAVSRHGLLATIAWGEGGKVEYALEGGVFVAGAAIQWLRDGLRMLGSAAFSEKYARKVDDCGGMYFVPAFAGAGAPHWDQSARGAIVGLTRGIEKEHFVRAALESLAYQSYDVIKAMEADSGLSIGEIRVDGGASANDFLMQFQADILDADVIRPEVTESSALGAVYLAGLAVGFYKDRSDIKNNSAIDRTFRSEMRPEKRAELVGGWRDAVRRSFGWAKR